MAPDVVIGSFKARWLPYVPPRLTFNNSTFCPHRVLVFCAYLRPNSKKYLTVTFRRPCSVSEKYVQGNTCYNTSHTHVARKLSKFCVISGFRRKVDKICALLGYYAACSGHFLPTFRENRSVPSSRDKNRHAGKKLPILNAQ